MADDADQAKYPSDLDAAYPDGDRVSTFDLKVYARAGIPRHEAVAWVERGIRPYQAEGFLRAGFDLDQAEEATRRGMPGVRAAQFVAEGRDPMAAWAEIEAQPQIRADATRHLVDLPALYTLTPGDIADLMGWSDPYLSRVSRETGFPRKLQPGPRYAVDEVIDYLAGREANRSDRLGERSASWAWGVVVRSLPPGRDSLRLISASIMITVAHRATRRSSTRLCDHDPSTRKGADALRRSAASIEPEEPWGDVVGDPNEWIELLRRLDDTPIPTGAPKRSTDLLERIEFTLAAGLDPAVMLDDARDALASDESTTSHTLVEQIVELARQTVGSALDRTDGTIYDPAVGEADLLSTVANRLGHRGLLVGRERDLATALIARARFLLRRTPARIEVGDTLASTGNLHAGLIVADLPFTRDTTVLRPWLRHILGNLSGRGIAVVALAAERNVIEEFIDHIAVLVLLPGRIRPGGKGTIAVMTLTNDPSQRVTFLDRSRENLATAKRLKKPSRRSSRHRPDRTNEGPDWLPTSVLDGTKVTNETVLEYLDAPSGATLGGDPIARKAAALLTALGDSPEDRELRRILEKRLSQDPPPSKVTRRRPPPSTEHD